MMENTLFNRLVESMTQMDEIDRGELQRLRESDRDADQAHRRADKERCKWNSSKD